MSDPALDAITALRDSWVDAVANNDPRALRDFLTDDYEIWSHGAAPLVGGDAAVQAMEAALAQWRIEQSFEPAETIVAGDWAIQRGVERMRLTPRSGGPAQEMTQRALLVLHRGEDARWRYARGMTNGFPVE